MDLHRTAARTGLLTLAVGMLITLSAELASAAPALVLSNLNMRQGPGTNFAVVATIPGGSTVDVTGCTGEWCTVAWAGRGGYAIARNLDLGGADPVGAYPPAVVEGPVVVAPPVYYGGYYGGPGYYGPRYYYGRRWGGRHHW